MTGWVLHDLLPIWCQFMPAAKHRLLFLSLITVARQKFLDPMVRLVAFEFVCREIVGAAIEVTGDTTHGPGIAIDRLATLTLQLEGLHVIGIETIESLLFNWVHG